METCSFTPSLGGLIIASKTSKSLKQLIYRHCHNAFLK
jgi:hypothetical protein